MGFRDQNNKVAPIDDGGSFDTDTNVNSVTSTSEAAANALAAANSAAAALVSENAVSADLALTNADVVLTHADVVLTNADLALTNADVVLTHADVVLAEADKVQTGLDRIAVAADLVLTNQDTIDTAADLALTNADVVLTNADVVLTHADVVLAEADKVQTGLDRIATNADVVLTNADVNLTNADVVLAEADKVQTGLDRIAVAADLVLTNADVVLTHADVVLAEADKVQTGLDRVAAANSQADAAVEASTATTKASEAAASASTAATQASNAATSATGASNSQIAAATSAASAAAVFDQFDDTYLGSKSTAPTVDNDGNTLVVGALYYNNATGGMFIWSGAEWVAASSAGGASLNNYHYTATSGQTAFSGTDENSNTLSYTVDNVIVTLNGVVLEDGTDYTATNGSVITLSVAAALSDELNVVAFKSFTTADMVSASNGGTFQGNVDFTSGIDVTGNITVTGNVDGRDVAADGTKLDAIEASADVTDTANVVAALTAGSNITIASDGTIAGAAQYTHPTHAGDDAAIDTGALSGATVISDLDFNITTDTLGHVTDANATVATRNLTLANLGYTGATDATNDAVANAALPKAGGAVTGDVSFNDNAKARFGAGNDLQIWHDGSNSYIKDHDAGNLFIQGSTTVTIEDVSGNNMAVFNDGGSVDLYHGATTRMSTTSSGIDVTGTVTADGLTVDGNATLQNILNIGGADPQIRTDTSDGSDNKTLWMGGGGVAYSWDRGGYFYAQGNEAGGHVGIAAGNISGASIKFTTAASEAMRITAAGSVGIGTSSVGQKLVVDGNIQLGTSSGAGKLYLSSSSGFSPRLQEASNALQFYTNNAERMRITAAGSVGINTSSSDSYYAKKLVVDCGTDAQNGITIKSSTTGAGMFAFADGTSGSDRYRGYINYNHADDSMTLGTAGGSGTVSVSSTGVISGDGSGLTNLNTGGTAPTSGTTYPVAFPFKNVRQVFYPNSYMPTPSGTITDNDGMNFSMVSTIAGTVTIRAYIKAASVHHTPKFRVVKNGTQVTELTFSNTTLANKDINVTFAKGDFIQIQFKATVYGQDITMDNLTVFSGTNALGCLTVGQ